MSEVEFEDETAEEIMLDGLQSKYVFARVTVNVKVHKLYIIMDGFTLRTQAT